MSGPTAENISKLRWLTILVTVSLFVADYGFDAMAKPVPSTVYAVLVAVALGIDLKTLRDLFLQFMRNWVANNSKNGEGK